MKRKILCLLMTIIMAVSVCGCEQKTEVVSDTSNSQVSAVSDEENDNNQLQEESHEAENDVESEEEIVIGQNIIPNGDFFENSSKWNMHQESGGSATYTTSGKLRVRIASPGRKAHSVQMYCDGFELLHLAEYEASFDISSSVDRFIEWRIQVNGGDYHPYYLDEHLEIGPDEKHVTAKFVMEEASDPAPRLCFNLGDAGNEQGLERHEVVIDNVSLVLQNASNAKKVDISVDESNININQIGYRPNDFKRAVFRDASKDKTFEVINAENGKSVYSGDLVEVKNYGTSYDNVAWGDFSAVTLPGTYFIKADNSGESFEFNISEDVYDDAFNSVCKMLYLQRCGMPLTKDYADDFSHGACHTESAYLYEGHEPIDVTGGWHDAGDYGRYTVPGAKTVADMMLAYESYPDAFSDETGIPESGNNIADVLDEVRYELEWLLKMQSENGGIYHKVTGLNFDGIVKPDKCTETLYVLPESKTATGDFAAVMFMASRVYSSIDNKFAERCLNAAKAALPYLEEHLGKRNYVNPKDVITGEYPDTTSMDEYLWALCEGYKTLGDNEYAKKIASLDYEKIPGDGLGWATVTEYAYYAYLTSEKEIESLPIDFKKAFINCANEVKNIALKENYGATIKDDYTWGSNMNICNNGIIMLMANELTGDDDYLKAAKYQLDYIMGTNTCSYCFITGEGTLSPRDPHHRPSQFIGKVMPGMLVGGPDSNLEDPFAKAVLHGVPNAHCYVDNAQSYSCNEITIYWNSPLIYLMAGLAE